MRVRDTFGVMRLYASKLRSEFRGLRKIVAARAENPGARIGSDVRILGIPEQLNIGKGCEIEDGALLDFRFGGKLILGENVIVRAGSILAPYGGVIRIGNRSGVNHYSVLYGHGGLTVGDFTWFAAHCVVIPANHGIADGGVPMFTQPLTKEGIVIGNDVWIGAHCLILDGVTIGDGSVIAAGAVVNKRVEPRTISAGVPAKVVRLR